MHSLEMNGCGVLGYLMNDLGKGWEIWSFSRAFERCTSSVQITTVSQDRLFILLEILVIKARSILNVLQLSCGAHFFRGLNFPSPHLVID